MKTLLFVSALVTLSPLFAGSVGVVVKTGMAPGKDPLVSVAVDLAGTLAVEDAAGRRVPCAVRADPSGRRFVAWRIPGAKMLELMDYRIVETTGPQEELADVPAVLPGMNLIANADFARRDANGDLADWAPSPRGYGLKDKWDETARGSIRARNGILALRGENACVVTYVNGLEEGHVYRLSFDGLCRKGRLSTSVWYQGDFARLPNSPLPNVGNYKTSPSVSTTGEWEHIDDASYVWTDKKTKRVNVNCRGLLKGTKSAYFHILIRDGVACVKNLRLEDVTSDTGVRAEIVK